MIYLNKDNIEDFNNRMVVAIFLQHHEQVHLESYVEKNHFRGRYGQRNDTVDMFIFDVPAGNKGEGGIVFKYMGRNTERNYEYVGISEEFVRDYFDYLSNPIRYLRGENGLEVLERRYPQLFQSSPDEMYKVFVERNSYSKKEKLLYKYKPNPYGNYLEFKENPESDDVKSIKRFLEADGGVLAFTSPYKLNDPFDCDCEIPFKVVFPRLLKAALMATMLKHRGTTYTPALKRIEEWWNKIEDEKKDVLLEQFDQNNPDKEKSNHEDVDYIYDAMKKLYEYDLVVRRIDFNECETLMLIYSELKGQLVNIKENFRILSLARRPDDILMWGYYCDGGKGACFEHRIQDIHKGIQISDDVKMYNVGLCVYGNIIYDKDKPQYDPRESMLSYIVRCTFTKALPWEHENEFRFTLIGGTVPKDKAIRISSSVVHRYMGVKYNAVTLYEEFKRNGAWPDKNMNVIYLKKDSRKFKLVPDGKP